MEQKTPTKRKTVNVGVAMTPEIHERVTDLARVRDWSLSQTNGYLIKLGLKKLEEIIEQQHSELMGKSITCDW
jgi:hypothetical protein